MVQNSYTIFLFPSYANIFSSFEVCLFISYSMRFSTLFFFNHFCMLVYLPFVCTLRFWDYLGI